LFELTDGDASILYEIIGTGKFDPAPLVHKISPVFMINMVGVLTSLCRKTDTGISVVLVE